MRRSRALSLGVAAVLLTGAAAAPASAVDPTVTFTILHTNDFHGQLQANGSNPGSPRVAAYVNSVRTEVGANDVLLVDAGDEMQGSLLSNLQHGAPVIATYNAMGYDVATFGNHEFDWGQSVLADRTTQADYPYVTANIVQNDTGNCATAGWSKPAFASAPYVVKTTANGARVAFIGVTTTEVPSITVSTATAGLCFKDPAESIERYYAEMDAASDVIVVLSHLGFTDGGYGYGIPVYGDSAATTGLASRLNAAHMPVNLIIGGHSHTDVTTPTVVGSTTVVQAHYNGRKVGRADLTLNRSTGAVGVTWTRNVISTSGAEDAPVKAVIDGYANDPAYTALVNTPVGYSAVDLGRGNGKADNMMGTFVDDAIYRYLNTDVVAANDVDLFLNNAGGIRADWCWNGSDWVNTGCTSGTHAPGLLTYGDMFTILPFGNQTVVGTMTGAQLLAVLNAGPQVSNGVIQPAGIRYAYYAYRDANPGPQPYAWGAFDVEVYNRTSSTWQPLDLQKTYRVGTNEFLAPAGGDGYNGFKYMTDITYWGDMLNAVNAYVAANHGSPETAYAGPTGNGQLDGRIVRDGTDTPDSGSIKPITILHNNDSHGNLGKTAYAGFTQLATLIKQERLHNPSRTLLLSGGDNVQGDAMMYYFKSAPLGHAADGSSLDPALQLHPMMAVMNALGYDAMTLGNHEFNFGSDVFKGILAQAQFPVLGANVSDDGRYGLAAAQGGAGVKPYVVKTLDGVKVAVVGITNHRVPNYELPSNITGLTFGNPMTAAAQAVGAVRPSSDVVIALSHLGFTENPRSVEVDSNVDTNLAAQVAGIDAIVGAHSHTNPASGDGAYKYLPTIVAGPDGAPVIINQAYRYNTTLGEIVIGVRAKAGGGYEVVTRTGQYLSVTSSTAEDAATKAVVDPYNSRLAAYNATVVGRTTAPIDTLAAYTQETNGANLQADASVWKLESQGIDVDVHLSGAMTNKRMAAGATPDAPVTLTVGDMFAGMPYENSLVVLRMNGPQLKAVLERAYRNYYYYKYVPGYGGYSYYTTCMLDTDAMGRIVYRDTNPSLPDGHNVEGFYIDGRAVDFADASTYYRVSTVNYLAAGSCNFNDGGRSLWPLDQIVADTQYYVRDAVIDYITHEQTVSPAIEGRVLFADVVSSTADSGAGSLRAAITAANADPARNAIVLDAGGTVTLASSLPEVTGDLVIAGPGSADLVIDGGGTRILSVAADGDLWLSGVTLRNGVTRTDGGAILNAGALAIENTEIDASRAASGGAIANDGTLSVVAVTFDGNSARLDGGAIANRGTAHVEASTFSGNHAVTEGGAIASTGTLELLRSTVTGNAAAVGGGGVAIGHGSAVLVSDTLARNGTDPTGTGGNLVTGTATVAVSQTILAGSTGGGDCARTGAWTTDADNLVQDASCTPGGATRVTGDPNLGPLAANGGPTRTMAVLVPSAAIDAGTGGTCSALDQRGVARARSAGDPCDIGAYETTDRTRPTASAPGAVFRVDATMSGRFAPVRLAWTGGDTGSGVARYEVERKVGTGAWTTVTLAATTPAATSRVSTTEPTTFRVRAVDRVGNVGAWATGPAITTSLVQQTGTGTTYGPGWKTATSTAYSGGSLAYASAKGTWVTFRFTGRSFALLTTEAPKRGVAKVYVNGAYAATIDLAASAQANRVVTWQTRWSTSATRTIKLVVSGTASRPRVDVDAFLVIK